MAPIGQSPPLRILFCMSGPNEMNGPNVWLARHLPLLRTRGVDARLLYVSRRPGAPCRFRDQVAAAGVPVRTVALGRYMEADIRAVCSGIEAEGPDLFSPNCFLPGYYACRFAREGGVSTVGVIHSDDPYYHDIVDVFVHGEPEWRLAGVVTVSRYLDMWLDGRCPPEVARLHSPCGVPLPPALAEVPGRGMRLVYFGRLIERQKRIHRVVRSMAAALRAVPGAEGVLYGDGPERESVAWAIEGSGLGARLRLGGLLDVDQVMPAMLQAHVLVLLSDFEGLSIALLEAMACGVVPVVARTRSGTDELLRHGENAWLVDPDDEAGFVRAVGMLRRDVGVWHRLSRAARATVEALGLTCDACADRWLELALRLRGRARRPGPIACPEDDDAMQLPPLREHPDGMRRVDLRGPRATLALLSARGRPVYVWGAGEAGRAFVREAVAPSLRLEGFIDSDPAKQGARLLDRPVFSPTKLSAPSAGPDRPFVFVASMYHREITPRLASLGYRAGEDFLAV